MKKLWFLLICIGLFPFISSFGSLIDPTSSYVPYTGATGNISIGIYNLTSGGLFPTTTLLYDIGTVIFRWGDLFVSDISADDIDAYDITAHDIDISGNFTSPFGNFTDLFVGGINVSDTYVDEDGDNMTGTLSVQHNLKILGNYAFKFYDTGGANQYSYMQGNSNEFRFSALGNQMNFYYGAVGSVLASSMDTSGNWNFTNNVEIFGKLNVTTDTWCNSTSCYNISDFLGGGGNIFDQSLNSFDNVTFNTLTLTGNLTSNAGAIFRGPTLGDFTTGYDNIRFGVWAHTPRVIFDNGTQLGQIDFISNSLRFIINDTTSGHTRTRLRINSTTVLVGETADRVDLTVWGDTRIVEDLYVTEDIHSNYSYSKNQVAQFHREAIATAVSADTWYNITFDLVIDGETIGNWYELTDSNSSVTINDFEGIIRIQGCIHPYNDNVGNQEATIYARVLVNGIEPRCLQRASSKDFKASGMDTIDTVGTVVVEDGDVITYQWRTTNTNLQLEGDSLFDNPVSASLNFERISNLE